MVRLLRVPLLPDEVLTSFASRTARANGRASARFLCADIGISYNKLAAGDRSAVTKFACIVDVPVEDLLGRAIITGERKDFTIAGERFQSNAIQKLRLRFCPRCFEADDANEALKPGTRRYRRSAWLVSAVEVCPFHSCRIAELEPHREERTDLYELLDQRQAEIQCLSQAAIIMPSGKLDEFIHGRLLGQRQDYGLATDMPAYEALFLGNLVGVAKLFGKHQPVQGLSKAQMNAATRVGFERLTLGEDEFRRVLGEIASQGDENNGKRKSGGLYETYGRLFRHLSIQPADSVYAPFLEMIAKHGADTMIIRGRAHVMAGSKKWISISEISRRTALNHSVVRRRLIDAKVIDGSGPVSKVPAAAMAIFENSGRLMKRGEACRFLGCDTDLIDRLVAAGLLRRSNPFLDLAATRRSRQMTSDFSESDLAALRQAIYARVNGTAIEGMLTIRQAVARFSLRRTDIIAGLIEGRYRNVSSVGTDILINDILLDPTELNPNEAGLVSSREALRLLGVWPATFRALMSQGIIQYVEKKCEGQFISRRVIKIADIEAFNASYASVRGLARSSGLSTVKISNRVKRLGIDLAFPPSKVKAWFVRQEDVARILANG
jgi:hypothetical protein